MCNNLSGIAGRTCIQYPTRTPLLLPLGRTTVSSPVPLGCTYFLSVERYRCLSCSPLASARGWLEVPWPLGPTALSTTYPTQPARSLNHPQPQHQLKVHQSFREQSTQQHLAMTGQKSKYQRYTKLPLWSLRSQQYVSPPSSAILPAESSILTTALEHTAPKVS